jgi:L-2-hydroxycarboxylate dehydrogenase (NAD+)
VTVTYREEDADFLEFCYYEIWRVAGATEEHAEVMARCTSHGDRMGKTLQGLGVFETPIIMLKSGNLDITSVPEIVSEGPGWLLVDGNRSSGQWAVTMATDAAVLKARETGVAIALGRNHNDAGCYSAYTVRAMEQGMIAIASNNSPPLVSPWGGMENVMSAAPFSLAAPGGQNSYPIVVDVQLIEADDGHVAEAALHGEKLSGKYLVDPETGELTDDPTNHFVRIENYSRVSDLGGPTVFSSPRIYALNCAAEVLTALMNPGATITPEVPHPVRVWTTRQDVPSIGGSFVLVIDPSHFIGQEEYQGKVDRFVEAVKSVKKLPGVEEIFLPGERGLRREAENRPVSVLQTHWESFKEVAREFGFSTDELRARWEQTRGDRVRRVDPS